MADFPGLLDAQRRAAKAVTVLRSAVDQLHPPRDGENLDDLATRLKGASVLAATASLELATVSGFHDAAHAAAHAAAEAGALGEERNDG